MNKKDQRPTSTADRTVKDGEIYDHADHRYVKVTGIWQRTQRLDTTRNADREDMIIVRYIPGEEGEWIDELAEPLDDFLDAIA